MKQTLLEMVQEILSDIDSDEVESINDTIEAEQVVKILESTYRAMMSNRNWPHLRRTLQVDSFNDLTKPTHMRLPEGVKELCFINYNCQKAGGKLSYQKVTYLDPDQFIHKVNQEDSTKSEVEEVVDTGGITLLIRNDRAPTYFTSFNDKDVVFNSYDNSVDNTLQTAKVQSQAYVMPDWNAEDDFVPDLPEDAFSAFVEEAKAKASYKISQKLDEKAEQEAGRQQTWLARKARRVAGGIPYPSYGRGRVYIPKGR
tara:strand:- start:26 stop:793 length:768 start_codon:yes stop_codon:yes gene_type:complete